MHLKLLSVKWWPFCPGVYESIELLLMLDILEIDQVKQGHRNALQNIMVESPSSPFNLYGLTLIPTRINDYTHYKVWDEIFYPFSNFNSCTVEVWEWISNFIPHITEYVIIYACRGLSLLCVVGGWEDQLDFMASSIKAPEAADYSCFRGLHKHLQVFILHKCINIYKYLCCIHV